MKENGFYKNKTILVTGGAGSIGSEIVRELIKDYEPKTVRVFDHNETAIFEMKQEFGTEVIRPFIGDVRDKERIKRAIEEVDIVFHAAALKHLYLSEYNPFEAVKTNVLGTQNVIDVAIDAGVEKMINISTDKAVNPINVMGATKLLTERLTTSANYYKGDKPTVFSSVRFGNVLNSSGSVVPIFKEQIKKGGPVTVTNREMRRFIMNIPKAVSLVLEATKLAMGEEIFILKMPVVKIYDLAEVMIEKLAPQYGFRAEEIKIKIIGERMGEKIKEELITSQELSTVYENEDMFIIYPDKNHQNIPDEFSKVDSLKEPRILSKDEIRKIISEKL